MTRTQRILERDGYMCQYGGEEAEQGDHLITSNQARRRHLAALLRDCEVFIVAACRNCNEAKGTRLLVPPSHEDAIPFLEAVTGGVYRVWRGDAKSLRTVCK